MNLLVTKAMSRQLSSSQHATIARFRAMQEANKMSEGKAQEIASLAYRHIKRGINCAIIVPTMDEVKEVLLVVSKQDCYQRFNVLQKTTDKVIFEFPNNPDNRVELRVVPKRNENLVPDLLGESAKIIDGKEGDPDLAIITEVMGWD